DLIRGNGRLAGKGTVEVDGTSYTARDVILSTGSSPQFPPIDGLDELDGLWTNREVTAIEGVPERLLILGGGPVGAEMAQAMSRLGASVALVEGEGRLLPRGRAAPGDALGEAFGGGGIERHPGQRAGAGNVPGDGYARERPGGAERGGDRLLVATGRVPDPADIGLGTVGIEPDKEGVQ